MPREKLHLSLLLPLPPSLPSTTSLACSATTCHHQSPHLSTLDPFSTAISALFVLRRLFILFGLVAAFHFFRFQFGLCLFFTLKEFRIQSWERQMKHCRNDSWRNAIEIHWHLRNVSILRVYRIISLLYTIISHTMAYYIIYQFILYYIPYITGNIFHL